MSVTFSFGPGPQELRIKTTNVSFVSDGLIEVYAPPIPASAGVLPRTTRVHATGCHNSRELLDRLDALPSRHSATFTYWPVGNPPSRLPRCFARDDCDRPPALFDELTGIPLVRHDVRSRVTLVLRSIPPGSRCEEWSALKPISLATCKQLVPRLLNARWEGAAAKQLGSRRGTASFTGCVLRPASAATKPSVEYSWNVRKDQYLWSVRNGSRTSGGCDLWPKGGRCLCIGAPPTSMASSPCATRLVSLFRKQRDLGEATSTRRDACEDTTHQRACLVAIQQQIPAPGLHEFEAPTAVVWVRREESAKVGAMASVVAPASLVAMSQQANESAYRLDLVVAVHSTPCHHVVMALLDAIDSTRVAATAWVYVKGSLRPAEAKRLAAHPQVRVHRLSNVGRCDHTYLHHVVSRYGQLAQMTVFLKDTVDEHVHLGYMAKLLSFLRRLPAPDVDLWGARNRLLEKPSFEMASYTSDTCRNKYLSNSVQGRWKKCYESDREKSSYVRAEIRPLDAWRKHFGLDASPRSFRFMPGGVFAATREAVRHSSLSAYKRLLVEMSQAANMEAGHFMERSWFAAFGAGRKKWDLMQVSLGIYRVVAVGGAMTRRRRGAVEAAPCNHTAFANAMSGANSAIVGSDRRRSRIHARIECLLLSDSPRVLAAAKRKGWRTELLRLASDGDRFRRAPHTHPALARFDYTAFIDEGALLNVPAVLETTSGRFLSNGASMVLLRGASPGSTARAAAASAPISTEVIVRRQSRAAALVGDVWQSVATAHPRLKDGDALVRAMAMRIADQNASLATASAPSLLSRYVSVLAVTDQSTPTLLLSAAPMISVWWEWWRCTAKGHGPASLTGSLRLSRCCKPTALLGSSK